MKNLILILKLKSQQNNAHTFLFVCVCVCVCLFEAKLCFIASRPKNNITTDDSTFSMLITKIYFYVTKWLIFLMIKKLQKKLLKSTDYER